MKRAPSRVLSPGSPLETTCGYDIRTIHELLGHQDVTTAVDSVERLPDEPATERQLAYAKDLGISVPAGATKEEVSDLLDVHREQELTAWFVYRVYRELVEGREHVSIDGPDHPMIQGIAAQLVQDDSVLKSIRRYRGIELIWFGEWTAPDGFLQRKESS